MSTTGAAGSSQDESAHHHQGDNEFASAAHHQQQAAAAAAAAAVAASNSASSSQHDILSGWDPEQIASLVSAARATATGNQATDASAAQLYEQARHALAQLPPNLGQAASALSEFAAGFKRSDGVSEDNQDTTGSHRQDETHQTGEHEQQQQDAIGDDSNTQQKRNSHSKDQHGHRDGQEQQQQQQQQSGQDQDQDQDPAATAAAIAAMGNLAGHQEDEEGGASANEDLNKMSPGDYEEHQDGSRKGGNKQPKGPETERQRKDNHKEVERKRRAGINLAITELQGLVPNCDGKGVNKGDIIFKAAQYIRDLKSNEASNIEKWTLEKLLMDQAMNDLSALLNASRSEVERLRERFGKEADEVPRAEEIAWEDQNAQSAHQHHHHSGSGQHPQQHEQAIDAAFESRQQDTLPHESGNHGHEDGGALGDVAAAAAAAARVVAGATNSGDEGGKTHDVHSVHENPAGIAATAASTTMRENVEAVRAAAAAAAAATNQQPQTVAGLPIADEEEGSERRSSKRSTGSAASPTVHPTNLGDEGDTESATGTATRFSKRQRV